MSFKIDSELSENQIESDVASYLGYVTPLWSRRFRLVSVDEQITGADKLFKRFIPIYLQFKVSLGLNPKVNILQRFRNYPLAKIIEYRKENELGGNPILYFQLRKMANRATDYQHNILFSLNNQPNQFALYVAPLTLELDEYEKLMNQDWYRRFLPLEPFNSRESEVFDSHFNRSFDLGINPFLRHHISIPPHKITNTHKHHYSFSKSGGNVAWHGGETFANDYRLSNQLSKILNYANERKDFGINQRGYLNFIDEFQNKNSEFYNDESNLNENPILRILDFTRKLKFEHKIHTMFLSYYE